MAKPKIIGIIPARGGSKGLPGKNIKPICGKPLIAWTIESALKSQLDFVVVSTDALDIAKISEDFGASVPFIRPKELACDTSDRNDVVRHALEHFPGYDFVVVLQPTSPLRTSKHIDDFIFNLVNNDLESSASVTSAQHSPYWAVRTSAENTLEPLFPEFIEFRRQDLPITYMLNGALFGCKTSILIGRNYPDPFVNIQTKAYFMLPEDSVDIDNQFDFEVAEMLLTKLHRQ